MNPQAYIDWCFELVDRTLAKHGYPPDPDNNEFPESLPVAEKKAA